MELVTVFSEKTDVPGNPLNFQFFYCCDLGQDHQNPNSSLLSPNLWKFGKNLTTGSQDYRADFVCVEVLRPSQSNGVMSSVVSLPNHTFTGQA